MADIRVWKESEGGSPSFPDDFEVIQKAVLQVTDIKTNRNKYYAVELHSAKNKYRVFTHYGRTDDLDSNPRAGVRESRFFASEHDAKQIYDKIYKEKTSARKGYKELSLASSKIGSHKSVGKSSGHVDDKTIEKMAEAAPKKAAITSSVSPQIGEFVNFIYSEATNALTSTLNVNITAKGIETPLGVLTLGQIDKGQQILDELWDLVQKKNKVKDKYLDLSGQFYTVIPHRLGRSRDAINQAVISTIDDCNQKQDTLQLMRDMLSVNGDASVLMNPEIDKKYKALGCDIEIPTPGKFKEIKEYVEGSVVKSRKVSVKKIYAIRRKSEHADFSNIGNQKLLFHGSNVKNWVGILSRGLLMPKIAVSLGVHRTDAGWLGNGIYFGDAICTTLIYAHPGKKGTRLATVANVALGKQKTYTKITYGIQKAPDGFDSCHGVRRKSGFASDFDDDEFVIYDKAQQRMDYVIEYTG